MEKKICFFIGSVSGKGGTERVCIELANNLAELGYQISIISLYEGKSPFFTVHPSIKLYEIFEQNQSFTKHVFSIIFQIRKLVLNGGYDMFISVETILCMYSVPALKLAPPVKHLAWEHFNLEVNFGLKVRKWARWLAANYCTNVIVLTQRDKQLWENKFKKANNIICIPNSAITPKIQISDYETRDKLIIAVGRLTYQKGFDILIKAWAMIANRFPAWKLSIIGSGEDEPVLQKLISSLNLEKSVNIVQATTQINQYYNRASIFCLSSRFEGLPMVLIEAQQFGLPIVSFDCNTGPAEVVSHDLNGLLCEPGDENELANALADCIADDNKRDLFNKAALQSANRFNAKPVFSKWIDLFNSIYN